MLAIFEYPLFNAPLSGCQNNSVDGCENNSFKFFLSEIKSLTFLFSVFFLGLMVDFADTQLRYSSRILNPYSKRKVAEKILWLNNKSSNECDFKGCSQISNAPIFTFFQNYSIPFKFTPNSVGIPNSVGKINIFELPV